MKILSIDRSKCNGCGACQAVCSLCKGGQVRPAESRIRLHRAGGPDTLYADFCQHCAEPVCVTACLKGIISKDPRTGVVGRRTEGCFSCAACLVQCPVGAVVYDSGLNAYVNCDQCGGDPWCVKVCPTGALSFQEEALTSAALRGEAGRRLFMRRGAPL